MKKEALPESINEKSELFAICCWIKETEEYKNHDITDENSIFYHVPVITYARLIQKFNKEKPF